jgi:DNA-binding transcriptional LysR family regulator
MKLIVTLKETIGTGGAMDLFRAMETFIAVVDQNGFASAGRAMGQSKAQVSRIISGLEDHLGVRVLQRSTRQRSLTEEGQRYLAHAREFVEGNARLESELSARRLTPRGRLRINAPLSYGERFIGPLLPAFMARYPEVDLDVTLTDRFTDLVEEGYDVAVRIGGDPGSNLIARNLGVIRHGLFASPSYLKNAPILEEAGDFKDHVCLGYAVSGDVRPWSFRGKKAVIKPKMVSNNGDLLRSSALDGVGLVMLPRFFVEQDLADGKLINLIEESPPGVPDIGLALMAVYPERRHLSLKVRVFVDYLAQALSVRAD